MSKILIFLVCIVLSFTPLLAQGDGITWDPAYSGNYTVGRGGNSVQYVIIHVVQGSYAGCISWFKNPSAKVSAHYVVAKGGSITQMVKESDTGWHAGNWTYNQRSIGIEHEGYVSDPGFPDAMYRSSAQLVRDICNRHGIPQDRQHIIGHVEVPGATHTDPGSHWDWNLFMSYVHGREPITAAPMLTDHTPANSLEEYRLTLKTIHFNVEKLYKSVRLVSGKSNVETMVIGNVFENPTALPLKDLHQYLGCECEGGLPEIWSETVAVSLDAEQGSLADLVTLHRQYECDVWLRSLQGDWQKVGTLTALGFQGYRVEYRQ